MCHSSDRSLFRHIWQTEGKDCFSSSASSFLVCCMFFQVYSVSLAVFTVGAILCTASQNMLMLIISRGIAGVALLLLHSCTFWFIHSTESWFHFCSLCCRRWIYFSNDPEFDCYLAVFLLAKFISSYLFLICFTRHNNHNWPHHASWVSQVSIHSYLHDGLCKLFGTDYCWGDYRCWQLALGFYRSFQFFWCCCPVSSCQRYTSVCHVSSSICPSSLLVWFSRFGLCESSKNLFLIQTLTLLVLSSRFVSLFHFVSVSFGVVEIITVCCVSFVFSWSGNRACFAFCLSYFP